MGHLPGLWDPPAWGGAWKRLLLAASVLGSCLQPAPAQSTRPPGTIVLSPPSPVVGGGVSLALRDPPQNAVTCAWYRSATSDEPGRILTYYPSEPSAPNIGPAHTGRETGGPGCALHIAGVTLSDTGNYSLLMEAPPNKVTAAVFVHISDRPPNPSPEPPSGLSPGAIAGIVIGSLAGAALVGGLLYFLLCRNGRGPEQHVPVGGQAASPPSQDVGDKKPTMADPDVHYSTLAFGSGAQKPAPGPQPQRENGTVYSEIKKK